MTQQIRSAIVLSAGFGSRMRPVTDSVPKPLVPLAGRALIDHVLDRLADAGIRRAVVNVHYLADTLVEHLRPRADPEIRISDERQMLLDTGGGVKQALPLLGDQPFVVHNSDSVWIEGATKNLDALVGFWNPDKMDCLLLMASVAGSLGYIGEGDFNLDGDGRLSRRKKGQSAPFVFAGVSIMKPQLFENMPSEAFSLNVVWDQAIARKRLYGITLQGQWMHVGTTQALQDAELVIANSAHA